MENSLLPKGLLRWLKPLDQGACDLFQAKFQVSSLFDYAYVKINHSFLREAVEFWDPVRHVFRFNRNELCPTMEEFGAILGRPDFKRVLVPAMTVIKAEDLIPSFGISLRLARLWLSNSRIILESVISHFAALPFWTSTVQIDCYLNAVCVVLVASFLFVGPRGLADASILPVTLKLKECNLCMLILADTPNGLDKFVREEAFFLGGSPLLLQVSTEA